MASFLLVHGAMGGAWVWGRVEPGLRAAGHETRAIDLPGAIKPAMQRRMYTAAGCDPP